MSDAGAGYDVIVVGAGMAGLYGVKHFRDLGLRVLGLEAAADVGGVWFHNAYPGARVDVESLYYCYYFDPELFRSWQWTERLATQPELLSYYRHVADRYDLRTDILFEHRVTSGTWDEASRRWIVTTEPGARFGTCYLVMATGQLSKPKQPPYPGLDDFAGEWTQTAAWRPVPLDGERVAVMGTGSSGVQAVTAIAPRASQLYVLQRTPGYVVPVQNGPLEDGEHGAIADSIDRVKEAMLDSPSGLESPPPFGRAGDFGPPEQLRLMEERWAQRPFDVFSAFSDFATDADANEVVAEFVRGKIAALIDDPALHGKLINRSYPIGARRIVFASGYYESFNRPNVSLIDLAEDPLDRFIPSGLRLRSGREIELDTVVFAIGFDAFMGAIDEAGIRNHEGARPADHWVRGPQTLLGLMTRGFPNFFIVTGPGSPATLSSNMNLTTGYDIDYIGGMITHARNTGATRIEPSLEAVNAWSAHVQEVAQSHLRLRDDNYMVTVTEDGTRTMIPYTGGVDAYVRRASEIADAGYEGFEFS